MSIDDDSPIEPAALLGQRLQETSGSLISPLYEQTEVSNAIHLADVKVQLIVGNDSFDGTAQVVLRFTPDADLIFDTTLDQKAGVFTMFGGQKQTVLRLVDRGVPIEVLARTGDQFVPKRSIAKATRPTNKIKRTVFHIFNFPAFFAQTDYIATTHPTPDRTHSARCSRVILRAAGWIITIAGKDTVHRDGDRLKERGGWLLTHVGEIVREDGGTSTGAEIDNLLSCLHALLSFAIGRWAAVGLPVGFDEQGQRVFERWGLPLATGDAWKGISCWFDAAHGESLVELFPGFLRLWQKKAWRRPLAEAIYWYIGATSPNGGTSVDIGLIIAQTAMELLAWNYCVRQRAMVTPDAFAQRGLSAANKFRLLASSLGIPLALPKELSSLNAGNGFRDSMDAITSIRNSLVHPHANRERPAGSEADAWRLSLWYLDLVILRLRRYRGEYSNRLRKQFAGEVEQVPWARSSKGQV